MRESHQQCLTYPPDLQGNEFWPETGKNFKAMGGKKCSSHSAILRWKITLNLSKRLHKIIALDSFEESSWHTTSADSGLPHWFRLRRNSVTALRLCKSQTPLLLQRLDRGELKLALGSGAPYFGRWNRPQSSALVSRQIVLLGITAGPCVRPRARGGGQQGAPSRALQGPYVVRYPVRLRRCTQTSAWSLRVGREAWGAVLTWKSHQRCPLRPWDLTALDQPTTSGFDLVPFLLLSTKKSLILLGN